MSESHGTALRLKRHEDLAKVAAYVKQQVREKSIEQLGEDLSEDDKYVGLQIKEDENEIIWHDYGHHGDHLEFTPIAESVIKEFPGVEMERQDWWGSLETWNYVIADGKWQQYTLWKFVAYTNGKGEEVQLEYKEPKDGRTEEEKYEERDRMCKEMAERLSQLHPDVEIAVYTYDWWQYPTSVEEFYKAKDGRATKEMVDRGLVEIMACGYIDTIDWVESIGHMLLHPMEFATELIKRARNDEDYCPQIATEMLLHGDTAKYFSLIEPADKEWLMKQVDEHDNQELLLERIKKGDEEAAVFIDDRAEEFPEEFCYTLTGDAKTLDAVEKLINDLCQQFGTPGNEMGLYVPQQILMKLLVGSDSIHYRGNVISMERQASNQLVITTEADKGEPLLYALRECFENLEIEMKA